MHDGPLTIGTAYWGKSESMLPELDKDDQEVDEEYLRLFNGNLGG